MKDREKTSFTPDGREVAADDASTGELVQRENALLSAILDTVGALVLVLDARGRIVRFNRQCERLTGYSFSEVAGRYVWDLFLRPAEVETVQAVFAGIQAGNFPTSNVNHWLTRDGERRLISWSNTALLDDAGSVEYVVATGLDITHRRRAEDEMRILSRAVQQSPSTVVITDTAGNIEYVNPKFTEVTGYSADEVLGRNPRLLKAGEQPTRYYGVLWETIRGGEEWRGEFCNRKKNGELYWEMASISPIRNARGTITGFLKVGEDISQRKRVEEALHQRTAELEARNAELDAFAHTVAHDLQNPLNVIAGFAEVLERDHDGLSDEEQRHYLQTIARNGRKMSNIVEELLLLASVRMANVEKHRLDMASIVSSVQARLSDMIEEHQAQVALPDSWPAALGYAPWIEEVWANYLSNAIRYGGRPPRIALGAEVQAGGTVRFWVRDNGAGLAPGEQAKLFQPFTQLNQVHAGGHGLGLSIVRRIVEKLDGGVGVESEGAEGKGSVFYFTLPQAPGESL